MERADAADGDTGTAGKQSRGSGTFAVGTGSGLGPTGPRPRNSRHDLTGDMAVQKCSDAAGIDC